MIYLKVRGRLGNQFFQYASVKNYQMKYYPSEKIAIDFSDLRRLGSEEDGFVDSLCNFKVDDYDTVDNIPTNIIQKIFLFIMKVPNPLFRIIGLENKADIFSYKFEKFMQPLLNKIGIFYMIHGYYPFASTKAKNKIFIGNFESALYFDENREKIRELFTPKFDVLDKNKEFYKKIKASNSVCITIRRGDFVDNVNFKKVHYVCDSDYFYRAIDLIKKKVNNPTFVVFSDDIEWVKNNMDFGGKAIYEDGNDPIWEKIRLMSACQHFIISNSTFSWWSQYLSESSKKVVIAPKRWKNVSYKKNAGELDIYQNFWLRI